MTSRMVWRLVLSTASLAWIGTFLSAGMAMVARMPTMAMTMISSSRVKPRSVSWHCWIRFRMVLPSGVPRLPLPVRHVIQSDAVRQRVDVIDVLSAPGGGVGLVLVAAQPPFALPGHRVEGNAAQQLELLVHLSDDLHPLHQDLQLGRIAFRAQVHRNQAHVAVPLVLVDRVAHVAQRRAQLHLLGPPRGELGDRQGHGGEDHQDRGHHDQLGQREAFLGPLETSPRQHDLVLLLLQQPRRSQPSWWGSGGTGRARTLTVVASVRSGSTGSSAASSACVEPKPMRASPPALARKVTVATEIG